jgi:hypothetical protein
MVVEVCADHLAIFRPAIESVDGGVGADETFAVVVHKGEQIGFLLV